MLLSAGAHGAGPGGGWRRWDGHAQVWRHTHAVFFGPLSPLLREPRLESLLRPQHCGMGLAQILSTIQEKCPGPFHTSEAMLVGCSPAFPWIPMDTSQDYDGSYPMFLSTHYWDMTCTLPHHLLLTHDYKDHDTQLGRPSCYPPRVLPATNTAQESVS